MMKRSTILFVTVLSCGLAMGQSDSSKPDPNQLAGSASLERIEAVAQWVSLFNGKKVSWLKPWQVHGSIYGVMPAMTGYLKPVGEWNEETIICIEDHIKVILNGAVIVDAYLENLTPVDGKAHPGLKRRAGHISLAGHNDRVEFRNLRIAEFAPANPVPESESDNTPPPGFTSLFNGIDLEGWKGLAHKNANDRRALKGKALLEAQAVADEVMKAHWRVVDGVLTYDGKGQSLCTANDYADIELYIDWKIPPGADSGIYLRGTPQIQIWDPRDARLKDKSISGSCPTKSILLFE